MKALLFTLICLLCGTLPSASACSCAPVDNFCESVVGSTGEVWSGFRILYVNVESKDGSGISAQVLQVLHGQDFNATDLFIVNGGGADCSRYTDDLEIGQAYIFAVYSYLDDWAISLCGVNILKVEGGTVKGAIAPGLSSISLEGFAKLPGCGEHFDKGPSGDWPVLQLAPTLSATEVLLRVNNSDLPTELGLEVFDALGRRVHQRGKFSLDPESDYRLDVSGWQAGCYFFRVWALGRWQTFKVVKVSV